MFCNRQKHIESKSIFYQSIVILFLLQNPPNKHNCVQISIKIIESSKKSSILQNLPSYIPFQSAAIDRWPRYATVASDLFSFQFHLFLFSRFVNNSRGGRGGIKGGRVASPQREEWCTYMADRHFIPRTCSHALRSVDVVYDSREKARFYRATRAAMKRRCDRCLEVDRFSRSIVQRMGWILYVYVTVY